ncbi:flagellar assembly protein FliX [Azospirillum sp.]|uniref:flagellar assembly protein FliX n=1 Tax=Azospirillum sp. TaxID=34012 RepID=UPI002D5BA893|nr:flagellar assembly protein FliX [Azospirillum sp.]HYF86345.1 flagellar assembly protein FliX [Azospirillum sp.]
MKVEGPGNLRGSGTVRRTGKTDASGGASFAKQLVGDTTATHGVTGASAVFGVSSVLALQEVDDATARASRGKMRAQDMLDIMDEIRHGLLAGSLSAQKLMDLQRVVQSRKVQVDDPKLAEILDEIDLRAQVELAKLQSS